MSNQITENMVGIANKLYQIRQAMIQILGPKKFKAKVEEYRPIIEKHKTDFECNDLEAVLALAKIAEHSDKCTAEAIVLLFACGVEIMEHHYDIRNKNFIVWRPSDFHSPFICLYCLGEIV